MKGQLHGTISYVVHSAIGPVASHLPPEQALGTGSHAQLLQLFPGSTTPTSPAAATGCSRTTLLMAP